MSTSPTEHMTVNEKVSLADSDRLHEMENAPALALALASDPDAAVRSVIMANERMPRLENATEIIALGRKDNHPVVRNALARCEGLTLLEVNEAAELAEDLAGDFHPYVRKGAASSRWAFMLENSHTLADRLSKERTVTVLETLAGNDSMLLLKNADKIIDRLSRSTNLQVLTQLAKQPNLNIVPNIDNSIHRLATHPSSLVRHGIAAGCVPFVERAEEYALSFAKNGDDRVRLALANHPQFDFLPNAHEVAAVLAADRNPRVAEALLDNPAVDRIPDEAPKHEIEVLQRYDLTDLEELAERIDQEQGHDQDKDTGPTR